MTRFCSCFNLLMCSWQFVNAKSPASQPRIEHGLKRGWQQTEFIIEHISEIRLTIKFYVKKVCRARQVPLACTRFFFMPV